MTRAIEVDGYRFGWRCHGDPGRPAILFLHGFLGVGDEFDALAAGLADAFYCIGVDLPGHGATRVDDGPNRYRMAETAEALTRLLAALDITEAALVGYSMGGRLALYLAVHFPAILGRAVLIAASPGLETPAEQAARRAHDRRLAEALERDGLGPFLARWYDQPLFATLKAHPVFPQVLARRRRNAPAGLARSLLQLGTGAQPSLWPHLATIQVPLQLLVGAQDAKFVAINAEMAARCPTARFVAIPGCGHAVHLEAPDQVGAQIRDFLQEDGAAG
ncbi:2-succinyl-6-hydroxy-2,4-cyclohexadiene-1-carboxylate synthase [Thioflavicoccus mobilis 8321]|uniref:Putative 2-succinyl-6-hydroxy-2,4-cyclohexadiene-1-carboxylate synthase n=1 Tax=Thioflavicoccus mobilis 8321 TaxID=765912 RepID=L0GSH7_9GAMM|nr:2-succinyl-6-hydroxy-2,4-cyclohexadiene-1-carboxylate synthase [Thioflavicoccus mobilis]AGA89713.1 2-succinyl-6-hydroxy-2,4-cyclohexadiene-1-carboxylate synthase [Thioflavicoccus mobilis 8321]